MFRAHDCAIKGIGFIAIPANESPGGAHTSRAAQALAKQCPAQATAPVRRHGSYRFNVGAAGNVIEPHSTERGNGSLRGAGHQIEIAAIEGSVLDVAIPAGIISVFNRYPNITFMKKRALKRSNAPAALNHPLRHEPHSP